MKRRIFKNVNDYIYWIIIVYLIVGAFFPIIGWIALICMVGPVVTALWRGRFWCGHVCPRGSFWDNVMQHVTLGKTPPAWLRSKQWRAFMVGFIFMMFGVQMYFAWGDWAQMGKVFWNIILLTSVVGIVLGWLYTPRTWCMFCPMGTLSALVTSARGSHNAPHIQVSDSCVLKCKNCARYCPMELNPYASRGQEEGFLHPDCIKCGRCTTVCPAKATKMTSSNN